MNPPLIPNAKLDNIVVQEFSDEILIYNLKTNKAYSLNETSTLVWKNCDGTKNIGQIAKDVQKHLKDNVSEDLILLALDSLKKEGLISLEGQTNKLTGLKRREVIKSIGLATMVALPLVVAITAPVATNAQSGVGTCGSCVTNLGTDDTGVCPDECATEMCTCFGNNSCMGVGQLTPNVTCEACKGIGGANNNSWRCGPVVA